MMVWNAVVSYLWCVFYSCRVRPVPSHFLLELNTLTFWIDELCWYRLLVPVFKIEQHWCSSVVVETCLYMQCSGGGSIYFHGHHSIKPHWWRTVTSVRTQWSPCVLLLNSLHPFMSLFLKCQMSRLLSLSTVQWRSSLHSNISKWKWCSWWDWES